MAIRIVTDSTADLPKQMVEDLGIIVVPLNVHFGEDTYLDWVELTPEAFFDKLPKTDVLPRTSQPSPGDFAKAYEEAGGPKDSIISIHISHILSGTYQSATMAKDMLADRDITVIDSKFTSMALGFIAVEAARAVKEGKSKEEVLELIHYYMEKGHILFMVDTLEYLQKNGRIGKAAAFLGGLLKMKPILSLKDGAIVPVEKARGSKKALQSMVDLLKEKLPPGGKVKGAVVHGNALATAEELVERIKDAYDISELIITPVGAVIGCHTGPGLVGLLFFPEKE